MAWAIAGIWDCLIEGRVHEARARAALSLASIDQQSLDSGSWILAQELSLEASPPMSSFQQKRSVPLDASESFHTKLIDARWADLLLHRVKELESYLEAKKKLGKPKSVVQPLAPRICVPGAAASTVNAQSVWASLRSVLEDDPGLRSFLCTGASSKGPSARLSTTIRQLSASLGSLQKESPEMCTGAELTSLVFDHLHSFADLCPRRGPLRSPFVHGSGSQASEAINSGWGLILDRLIQWNSSEPVTADCMGRAAGKVEKLEEQVAALAAFTPGSAPKAGGLPALALAKDVEVDRLAFSPAPSFDPGPFLDNELRLLYEAPLQFASSFEDLTSEPPRVRVRTTDKQARLDLLAALDAGNRLIILPAEDVDSRASCGMFTIPY